MCASALFVIAIAPRIATLVTTVIHNHPVCNFHSLEIISASRSIFYGCDNNGHVKHDDTPFQLANSEWIRLVYKSAH